MPRHLLMPPLVALTGAACIIAALAGTAPAVAQTTPSIPEASPSAAASPGATSSPAAQSTPGAASTPTAVPEPSAAATPTPNPLTLRGYLRSYYFTRQNASSGRGGAGQTNQASFNTGVSLHADYRLGSSGFSVGASYLGAYPFNGDCSTSLSHLPPTKGGIAGCNTGIKPPGVKPDDTLPGFELSTFYETYLLYKDRSLGARIGDILITTPWANASDSRIKPAAFQGADVTYAITKAWSVEAMDMIQFEGRTASSFQKNTLLTSVPAGSPGLPLNTNAYPGGPFTDGFQYLRLGYNGSAIGANVHGYVFDDIASLIWLDAKYTVTSQRSKPFLAIQAGQERDTGRAVLGRINSTVYGAQIGGSPAKGITVSLGYNFVPVRSDVVSLGAGACSPTSHQIRAGVQVPYFLPTNSPQCVPNADGTTTVFYGGIASPYTDSYATDPLFTTSLTQGMADRRAPGNGEKLAVGYTTPDKRLILTASRAYYDFGSTIGGWQQTAETDADIQYFAMRMPKSGPYKGLLLRYRYGARTYDKVLQPYSAGPLFGGVPLFKYNRAQLEYDFL